jgi:hypothetical protein
MKKEIPIDDLDGHGDCLWFDKQKGIFVLRAIWLHKKTHQFYMYTNNVPQRIELSNYKNGQYHYGFLMEEERTQ